MRGRAGAAGGGWQGVLGGVSDYLLERCLHIFKSYVSCLGIKYDIVFYLFAKISWSHSNFHLLNRLLGAGGKQNKKKNNVLLQKLNSDVFFYCFFHALCCIVLFIETSTCTRAERPTLEGVRME